MTTRDISLYRVLTIGVVLLLLVGIGGLSIGYLTYIEATTGDDSNQAPDRPANWRQQIDTYPAGYGPDDIVESIAVSEHEARLSETGYEFTYTSSTSGIRAQDTTVSAIVTAEQRAFGSIEGNADLQGELYTETGQVYFVFHEGTYEKFTDPEYLTRETLIRQASSLDASLSNIHETDDGMMLTYSLADPTTPETVTGELRVDESGLIRYVSLFDRTGDDGSHTQRLWISRSTTSVTAPSWFDTA